MVLFTGRNVTLTAHFKTVVTERDNETLQPLPETNVPNVTRRQQAVKVNLVFGESLAAS